MQERSRAVPLADSGAGDTPRPRLSFSVVVPTLDRPRPLARALKSITAGPPPSDVDLEVIVVDNSLEATAESVVREFATRADIAVRLLRVPRPGIATARNAGVTAARGEWVAFIDDDQEASDGWLAAFASLAVRTDAVAIFGPIRAASDDGQALGADASIFERLFDAVDGADITRRAPYLGTNNSCFRRLPTFAEPQPFNPALDGIGGEDSLLLASLVRRGHTFAWARGAEVVEWVPRSRLDWRYLRRRRFLNGQVRSFVHAMVDPPRWSLVVFWMSVGALQASGAALAWLVSRPLAPERAHRLRLQISGGLGKVLWMPQFRESLYGGGHVS